MENFLTPGVYRQDVFPQPELELKTGIPAFLGFADKNPSPPPGTDPVGEEPYRLTVWPHFENAFSGQAGFLAAAVRGFFENGGRECHVVALDSSLDLDDAWRKGLGMLEGVDQVDLVCAPDALAPYVESGDLETALLIQQMILQHCDDWGDRFAVLDALPGGVVTDILSQRAQLESANGALYGPWVRPVGQESPGQENPTPPCGHLAGIFARTDAQIGVWKAPANEVIEGIVDLETTWTDVDQAQLNPAGVNALRAFSGRGIRVWGARTLSDESAWTYINVRRLATTTGRWLEHRLGDAAFEPNDTRLWARIERESSAYLTDLHERGALRGNAPEEAFFVKCDAETNPPEVRDAGRVVTEIGLAPTVPGEFVIVRIVQAG